jgi:Flp pilus assembly protein protease CpaA
MELIIFGFALAVTLFAGAYDLKTSNVHEEVPAILIAFGLFYWLIRSLVSSDLSLIVSSIVSGAIFLILSQILYYAKVWGDGDAWIMAGLGFCLPNLFMDYANFAIGPFSAPLHFLFNLFLVGGIYTIGYIAIYGFFDPKLKKSFIGRLNRHRAFYAGSAFGGIMASFFVPYFFLIGIIPILYAYAKTVEAEMKKKIPASELTEDHVIAGGNIRGVTSREIEEIRKKKEYIEVQDGIRFTIVFPLTLVFLYYGGFFGILARLIL